MTTPVNSGRVLLSDFYKPRWQQFFNSINDMQHKSKPVNIVEFENQIKNWEWAWVKGTKKFPTKTKGDAVNIALAMYKKYRPFLAAIR